MYVFVTPACRKSAERLDCKDRLDKVVADLEGINSLGEALQRFDPLSPPYLKMPDGRLYRLFARLARVGTDQTPVICFFDVYQRKDGTYVELINNITKLGPQRLDPLLDLQEVARYVANEQAAETAELRRARELPILPEALWGWLLAPEMSVDPEVVYETDEWVTSFRRQDIKDRWETYHELVFAIASGTETGEPLSSNPLVRIATLKGRSVAFARYGVAEPAARGILFLLAPFSGQLTDDEADRFTRLLPESSKSSIRLDDFAARAERSYPAYLLGDPDVWYQIERESEANLSLSAEEEDVLFACSRSRTESSPLPAFLNGRAGSGKSTLLLYLFADYVDRRIQGQLEGEPLLLTYSERLVDAARAGVKSLLSSHARYLARGGDGPTKSRSELQLVDRCIQPFQRLLLSLLPADERTRFSAGRYVDFHRFKRLYTRQAQLGEEKYLLKLPQAQKYSPELAWHVIRTFIKGRSVEYLDPDDYRNDVERREYTVSIDTFNQIHDSIWDSWYRRITESDLWDDQDLVRRILELKAWQSIYTAIFCDEAQDLTRLELRLVLRLSAFSKYDLTGQAVPSLPFCFAGDPFQTLNPTGFRWAALRQAFEEEILGVIDPLKTTGLRVNHVELFRNYRSTPPIARATNLIQLWRHVLFDQAEMRPQQCWRLGDFPPPRCYTLGRNLSGEDFVRYARDTIILVPCESGQEGEFVRGDPVLSRMIQVEENTPPKNVFSAAAAKGLEFQRVILYGFGAAAGSSAFVVDPEAESSYDTAHFFNKLYVSASRPKALLFVVDAPRGDEQLWQRARDKQSLEGFLGRAKKPEDWRDLIGAFSDGAADGANEMAETDPGAIAVELEDKGLLAGNADWLRRARDYHFTAGNRARAQYCAAQAFRFDGQCLQAGKLLLELSELELAKQCFWEGCCFKELHLWYETHGQTQKSTPEARLCAFMADEKPQRPDTLASFAEKLSSWFRSDSTGRIHDEPWRRGINEFLARISLIGSNGCTPGQWGTFGRVIEELSIRLAVSEYFAMAGDCFEKAGTLERAVLCWEKGGRTDDRRFLMAKAELEGLPQGLRYLAAAEAHEKIVGEWQRRGAPSGTVNREWIEFVAPALQKLGRSSDACLAYLSLDDTARTLSIFPSALAEKPPTSVQRELFTQVRDRLIRERRWNDALTILEQRLEESNLSVSERRKLQAELVRELVYAEPRPAPAESMRWESMIERVARRSADGAEEGLSFREIGVAYERVGALAAAVRHYIDAANASGPNVAWARERWLAVRRKQVESQPPGGRAILGADALRTRTPPDVVERCSLWGISIEREVPEQPSLKRQRPREIRVVGLPSAAPPERAGEADVLFRIDHIEVRTYRDKKRVRIADEDQATNIVVDFGDMRAQGEFEDRSATVPSEQRALAVPASHYQIHFFLQNDGEMTLEITVGRHQPVRLSIPV